MDSLIEKIRHQIRDFLLTEFTSILTDFLKTHKEIDITFSSEDLAILSERLSMTPLISSEEFCQYKLIQGKNKGNYCGKKVVKGSIFCSNHNKNRPSSKNTTPVTLPTQHVPLITPTTQTYPILSTRTLPIEKKK